MLGVNPVDVVFVLDSSGSLTLAGWQSVLGFASSVVDMLPVGQDSVR
jgi:hypothetical protein